MTDSAKSSFILGDGSIYALNNSSYYHVQAGGRDVSHSALRIVFQDPIDLSNWSKCSYSLSMYGYKISSDQNQWIACSIGFTSNPNFTYNGGSYLLNGSFTGYGGEDAGKSMTATTSDTVLSYSGTIDLSGLDPDKPYYLTMLVYRCTYNPGYTYSSDRYGWVRLSNLTLSN